MSDTARIKPLAFAGDTAGYLTPRQAAAYIPYDAKTIRDMCAAQQITCLRLGTPRQARYKIHRDTIAAWLRDHTQQARKTA